MYVRMPQVLHWHMSDTQSFPFESKTHPRLWEGAYSSQEKYSQLDIADVVEHARTRGVRVMVVNSDNSLAMSDSPFPCPPLSHPPN
jgi:hypothetical protein